MPSFQCFVLFVTSCENQFRVQLQRSTSGIDEETVPKTAAPRKGVQSAILWCSAVLQLRRQGESSHVHATILTL